MLRTHIGKSSRLFISILVRPKLLQQVTETWQGQLDETKLRIGVTELLGFLAVAMSYELDGAG